MDALVRKRSNGLDFPAAAPRATSGLQKSSPLKTKAAPRAFAQHLGFRFFQLLPFHRPKPDVAAAEPLRPANPINRPIRARLRLAHGLAQRADVEHAAAVSEDAAAVRLGAGVEDFDALDLGRGREPLDHRALGGG